MEGNWRDCVVTWLENSWSDKSVKKSKDNAHFSPSNMWTLAHILHKQSAGLTD